MVETWLGHDSPGAIRARIEAVPGHSLVLIPKWEFDRRFPGSERAAALNTVGQHLPFKELVKFDGREVMVNYYVPIARGSPAISIRARER